MTRIVGLYKTFVQELKFEDKSEYKKLLRMTPQNFDETLGLIQDDITKTNTNMCDSIPTNTKLPVIQVFLLRVYTNISTAKAASIHSCFST